MDTIKEITLDENQRTLLKETQLEILDFFVDFCKKNNLTYYLFGGTLLGAIRHGGYIPWDDDLDVCMPYEDYYKMIDLFQKNEHYFLENFYTDKFYFYNFSKIMKYGTVYGEYLFQNSKAANGIYIDIFPINSVPEKKGFKYYFYYFWLTIINTKSYIKMAKNDKLTYPKKKHSIRNFIINLCSFVLLFWCSKKHATKIKYNFLKKHGSKKSNIITVGAGLYSRYPRDFFAGNSTVNFEGRKLNAPQNPDSYLRAKYGDYMKLPPEKDRIAHHFVYEFRA